MQQKRLFLALVISAAILVAWSYLFRVQPPQEQTPIPQASPQASPVATSPEKAPQQSPSELVTTPAQQGPQRRVIVRTPLYEVTFETRGAEPTSWIIKKNKHSESSIHSVGGSKNNPLPLQLVSPEGLKREPRQVPLQLLTGDATLDHLLSSVSYTVEGVESSDDSVEVVLAHDEKREISFLYRDPAAGLDVTKTLVLDGARYEVDLRVSLKRNEELIPNTRLRIGPSIGDQGISHYTFYSVAPEAVAYIGEGAERHPAQSINENKNSPDLLRLNGPIEWAGVGDTYFGMVVVPPVRTEGLEYRTTQYDHEINGTKEKRYLLSAFVPIPVDGSSNIIYTGPKDHYLLTGASSHVSEAVGRPIDLEALIDYGWFRWMSKPLAVPILEAIRWLKNLTNSYGIAIILFTIAIYSLFFPLKWRSSKAMKKAQKLAPKMKELQEKMKGLKQSDPRLKELQMEQLRLMKEGNPLGGCLPLLIQMPFLFALYRAITISLDFRQATFLWLPDLSAGDPWHVLEVAMAGTMIILQLITPAPSADPLQRKMMAIGMPIFMLYVLWGAPSGLLLYWLVGNIVGFSQQFLINYLTKSDDEPEPPAALNTKKKVARAAA
ncbi:MAG TPA: membrane protein insertase YidC [Pyrinomonadaceae bacterium]|nr:membrane protein insertase YidC [Pyrinomonadaceae bacterium]